MFGSAYQGTVVSLLVATAVYFVLNAIWTTYRGPGLFAEIGASVVLGPLVTWGAIRLYRQLFQR